MKSKISLIGKRSAALMLAAALVLGSFIIFPGKAYAAGISDIQVGDILELGKADTPGYTGKPLWRVLDKADDGSLMLMSEYLWKGNGSDNAFAGISFFDHGEYYKPDGQRDFRGTKAETWCNDFEAAVLKDVEGLTIKPQRVFDEEYYYEQTLYISGNKKLRFRKADAILAGNEVFFLSAQEAVEYLGLLPAARSAYEYGAKAPSAWYLRSTEVGNGNNCAAEVKADGELASVNADQTRAARPAFWAEFAEGTGFVSETDESGATVWKIGDSGNEPQTDPDPQPDPASQPEPMPQADADQMARSVQSVTVNVPVVNASAIDQAVSKAGGSEKYVTTIVLGSKVKKIRSKAFRKYTNVTVLEVKTKKLTKKSVKNSLKRSKIKTVRVKVSKKAKTNKKYVKKYKKIFTKKNAGKKVKIKK